MDTLVAQKGFNGLRSIFGNRSHNSVLKRANSIIFFSIGLLRILLAFLLFHCKVSMWKAI